jgi:hypothetical protein
MAAAAATMTAAAAAEAAASAASAMTEPATAKPATAAEAMVMEAEPAETKSEAEAAITPAPAIPAAPAVPAPIRITAVIRIAASAGGIAESIRGGVAVRVIPIRVTIRISIGVRRRALRLSLARRGSAVLVRGSGLVWRRPGERATRRGRRIGIFIGGTGRECHEG